MSGISDNDHDAPKRSNRNNIKGLWRDAFRTLKSSTTSSSSSADDDARPVSNRTISQTVGGEKGSNFHKNIAPSSIASAGAEQDSIKRQRACASVIGAQSEPSVNPLFCVPCDDDDDNKLV